MTLGISAFYEMIEWWAAMIGGGAAVDFLATQGDLWGTQWDRFTALIGAMTAPILLCHWHDRALAKYGFSGQESAYGT